MTTTTTVPARSTPRAAARPRGRQASPVLLTDTGRAALALQAELLRAAVLPELRAALAERNRDRRVDDDYHRVRDKIALLQELVSTAGSTRSRPVDGGIGVGDHVAVQLADGEQLHVLVTSEQEAGVDDLRISERSPLARALAGARPGGTVTVLSPAGAYPARVLTTRRE